MKKFIARSTISIREYLKRKQVVRSTNIPKAVIEALGASDKDDLIYEQNDHNEIVIRVQKRGE